MGLGIVCFGASLQHGSLGRSLVGRLCPDKTQKAGPRGSTSARLLATCNRLWPLPHTGETGNNRLLTNDSPSGRSGRGLWGCLLVLSTRSYPNPRPNPSRVLLSLFEIQIDMNCWPARDAQVAFLPSRTIDTYSEPASESESECDFESESERE